MQTFDKQTAAKVGFHLCVFAVHKRLIIGLWDSEAQRKIFWFDKYAGYLAQLCCLLNFLCVCVCVCEQASQMCHRLMHSTYTRIPAVVTVLTFPVFTLSIRGKKHFKILSKHTKAYSLNIYYFSKWKSCMSKYFVSKWSVHKFEFLVVATPSTVNAWDCFVNCQQAEFCLFFEVMNGQ